MDEFQKIACYMDDIKQKIDPKLPNVDSYSNLMHNLHVVSDQHFRANRFCLAHEFYYHTIFILFIIEKTFYCRMDDSYVSSIYCNAALCSLRVENYEVALKDSNNALKYDATSLKGTYRKVLSMKGLGDFQHALVLAREGLKLDASVFDPLVVELKELVEAKATPFMEEEKKCRRRRRRAR